MPKKESPQPADLGLGPCCACGCTGPWVRNLLCLPYPAPQPGTGWGCFKCGLPMDGALAVVCDNCLAANAPLRYACLGPPGVGNRVPIQELVGRFEHRLRFHKGELVQKKLL